MINRIALFMIAWVYTTLSIGQEILYIEYKDGRNVKEEVENISQMSFHHLDELPSDPVLPDITRGLVSYFNFDDETVNDTQNRYNGFMTSGAYITDTPNQGGKALFLKRGERVFIPFAPLDGTRNYSVSVWVKDFGSGIIFQTSSDYFYGPSLYVTEQIKARAYSGISSSSDNYCTFSTDLSPFQSEKWTMITVVTKTEGNSSLGINELYINGQLMETLKSYTYRNTGAVRMCIGGYYDNWADPMKVDNVRLYDVALTKDEVEAIYRKESSPSAISISPLKLYFDTDSNKKIITLNNKSLRLVEYATSSSLDQLTLSSRNGYIRAKGTKEIEVTIPNRDQIEAYANGSITFEMEGMYYSVDVQIEKGRDANKSSEEVTRGLQAYYKFDNETIDDSRNGYNGTLEGGTFITDTPNGKGKALHLKKGGTATIAYSPLDGKRNYTVSLWIKDFGTGRPFQCFDEYLYGPSLYITEEMTARIYTGFATTSDNYYTFNTDLSKFQSDQWTMITIVTATSGDDSQGVSNLYINGQRVNTGKSYTYRNNGAVSMSIGNSNSDPMKIDNVRLYSVALTDSEVMEIYNSERK